MGIGVLSASVIEDKVEGEQRALNGTYPRRNTVRRMPLFAISIILVAAGIAVSAVSSAPALARPAFNNIAGSFIDVFITYKTINIPVIYNC